MILDCAAAAVLQARGVDVGLLSADPVPNAYVEEFRKRLLAELEGNDSIRLGQ